MSQYLDATARTIAETIDDLAAELRDRRPEISSIFVSKEGSHNAINRRDGTSFRGATLAEAYRALVNWVDPKLAGEVEADSWAILRRGPWDFKTDEAIGYMRQREGAKT